MCALQLKKVTPSLLSASNLIGFEWLLCIAFPSDLHLVFVITVTWLRFILSTPAHAATQSFSLTQGDVPRAINGIRGEMIKE